MSPIMHSNQNVSDRLVRIIESNAEEITRGTVKKLQTSARTPSYQRLSYEELYDRAYEVYQHLDRWLWQTSNQEIRAWYIKLGEKRHNENVPLNEVLWALVLTKDRLLEYLGSCALIDSALELYQQQEFDRVIGRFSDRAVCYTVEDYEHRASLHGKGVSQTVAH